MGKGNKYRGSSVQYMLELTWCNFTRDVTKFFGVGIDYGKEIQWLEIILQISIAEEPRKIR